MVVVVGEVVVVDVVVVVVIRALGVGETKDMEISFQRPELSEPIGEVSATP